MDEAERMYLRIANDTPFVDPPSMDFHGGYMRLFVDAENVCSEPLEYAEVREDFNRVLRESHAGRVTAEVERDPQVVWEVGERPLLVERVGEGEIEPS